ncbi:DNA-3-methyladenine glycosylase 2, partial [Micromonospora sp. NPDC000207]
AQQGVQRPGEGPPVRGPVLLHQVLRYIGCADGTLDLRPGGDRTETLRRLAAIPGIDPKAVGYVAMRALGDPDVLLGTDPTVRRGAAALGLPHTPSTLDPYADSWRPWRSYATVRLWRAA